MLLPAIMTIMMSLESVSVYCGELPKRRRKMLRAEKITAALLSFCASSISDTFRPLILPPKRFEMPGAG